MDASDRAEKAESNQTTKPSSAAAGVGPQVSKRSRPDRASELEAGLLTVVGSAEVPEAVRDANQQAVNGPARPQGRPWLGLLGGLLGLGAIAAGGFAYLWSARQLPNTWQARLDQMIGSAPSPTAPASPTPDPNSLLGHLPYEEAPQSELSPISNDGQMRLRRSAARAYRSMAAAARADGVNLVVLSAFRSVEQQQSVFFNIKAARNQAATKRAEVSAPPGYSEHHTGYAVDIGDANAPSTNLNQNFEQTRAFRWLADHAARFNFELSFPEGNRQGVSYEPWHWRFVGDRHSLETFYKARQQGVERSGSSPAGAEVPESTPTPTDRPNSSSESDEVDSPIESRPDAVDQQDRESQDSNNSQPNNSQPSPRSLIDRS